MRLGTTGTRVCFWHKADVQTALTNVRFEGNNGHDADGTRCLLMTLSGHDYRVARLHTRGSQVAAGTHHDVRDRAIGCEHIAVPVP